MSISCSNLSKSLIGDDCSFKFSTIFCIKINQVIIRDLCQTVCLPEQIGVSNTWKNESNMHDTKWQLITNFTFNVCEAMLRCDQLCLKRSHWPLTQYLNINRVIYYSWPTFLQVYNHCRVCTSISLELEGWQWNGSKCYWIKKQIERSSYTFPTVS